MEPSLTGLKVLRAVADYGSFTAAAERLGYTQSAVSRQVAALERESGGPLFERRRAGVDLTARGLVVLRHARAVLDEIDSLSDELDGVDADMHEVRLGVFASGGAVLVPALVRRLRETRPDIAVVTREGTTPALVRAVRAGTLDLAVIATRPPHAPPDDERPPLVTTVVDETSLLLAVASTGRFAGRNSVTVDELADVDWIASPSSRHEPLMGVWPGVGARPRIVHSARDWLTKLHLVAADCGVTTAPPSLARVLPAGVTLLRVEDGPRQRRRLLVARLPGRPAEPVAAVVDAIHQSFPR